MLMQPLIGNNHKRLAICCLGWGLVQIIIALALHGSYYFGYLTCAFCGAITLLIWVIFPIIRRNTRIATISTKFYIFVRKSVFFAFLVCFVYPAFYGLISKDNHHMAFVVMLSISAFCSVLLASYLYGKSVTEFLER
jgi:hypothetical protein